MKQEIIATGKTIELAIANGAKGLGVDVEKITHEVIDMPKKGFLGVGAALAKVRVIYTLKPDTIALNFVNLMIKDMELDVDVKMTEENNGDKLISITGESAGVLIGHHGDTLDSLQYLVNLAANKKEEDSDREYTKISIDIENYRAKREETLRELAVRMATKVLKYKKSITLEPMSPYERRIIHSSIQPIEGVSTNSVGSENSRRVIVYLDDKTKAAKA